MIMERLKVLICKILSMNFLIWVIVTILHCFYVFPYQMITKEYLFFTTTMFGIKVISDRVKDKLGVTDANNTAFQSK